MLAGPTVPVPATPSAEPPRRFDAHVLLAEDNPVNIEVAREYLSCLGCRVTVVENGNEAIAVFAAEPFDLVLMDCHMPELDGLTATSLLRQWEASCQRPRTPIVALTANAYDEDRRSCLAVGMDDVLNKPCSQAQLEAMLVKWLPATAVPATGQAAGQAAGQADVMPSSDTPGVLDTAELDRLRSANPRLLERLIETYVAYYPKLMAQLLRAHASDDKAGMIAAAHGLGSSSANVSALVLARLASDLERGLKAPLPMANDARDALVDRIERAGSQVVDALTAMTILDPAAPTERAAPSMRS